MVFDNVFIPWDRVFLCGETKYCGRLITRFAKSHRMNCGGACKVGFADLIIGATVLAAEYNGVDKIPHIQDKLIEMVRLSETSHACAIAAAVKGREEPEGSGVFMPDDLFGNVAKLNIAHGFWEIMKIAGDIGGGLVVTMPRLKDLEHPEVGPLLEKFFQSAAPAAQAVKGRQIPPALDSRAARPRHLARSGRTPDPARNDFLPHGLRGQERRWPRSSWAWKKGRRGD